MLEAVVKSQMQAGDMPGAVALADRYPRRQARLLVEIARFVAKDDAAVHAVVGRIVDAPSRPMALLTVIDARLAAGNREGARTMLRTLLGDGAALRSMYFPDVRRAVVALGRVGDAAGAVMISHRLATASDRAHTLVGAAETVLDDAPVARSLVEAGAWASNTVDEDWTRDSLLGRLASLYRRLGMIPEAETALQATTPMGRALALRKVAFPNER
ncbi:MAG: hypothetical protein FJX65_18955 [Alphaproteobacteria bacterium]|nr:hypothetical protein [Alphaproteobacteria bacterium]